MLQLALTVVIGHEHTQQGESYGAGGESQETGAVRELFRVHTHLIHCVIASMRARDANCKAVSLPLGIVLNLTMPFANSWRHKHSFQIAARNAGESHSRQ